MKKKVIKSKYKEQFLPDNIKAILFCSVIRIVFQDFNVRTENIKKNFYKWTSVLTTSLIN